MVFNALLTVSNLASLGTNYGGGVVNTGLTGITNKSGADIHVDLKVVSGTVGVFYGNGTQWDTNTVFVGSTGDLQYTLQPGGKITNTSGTVTLQGAGAW